MVPQNATKPVATNQTRQNHRHLCRPKLLTCFNIFFALSLIEAISLIAVSFGSEQMKILGDASWFVEMAEELFLWESVNSNAANLSSEQNDIVELENVLAKRKENESEKEELDDDNLIQAEANQEAKATANVTAPEKAFLDNYSKRPHIPNNIPIPLIVGGSDGSGTRAFVDVLGRLGVPMLVDDRGTMDIHAQEMFKGGGWPPLVQMVMKELHTANYTYEDLPSNLTSTVMRQVALLGDKMDLRGDRLRSLAESKKSEHILAKGVKYGFKAPVSMLVIPLLLKHYGRIRFLHVVRDGRDVALSANQSPVQKFYRYYYADPESQIKEIKNFKEKEEKYSTVTSQKNIMAMQLWNDWNTQVHDWGQQFADGKTFDYLVMRTEDLLDPDTKFHALQQLANFVGSPKTKQEICCMSRRAVVDMGASGGIGAAGRHNRFAHLARNRLATMSREERIEALKQYRASRAALSGNTGRASIFTRSDGEEKVLVRNSVIAPPRSRITFGNANRIRPRRDADGIGIPSLEQSEADIRKDARFGSLNAESRPQNDVEERIVDRMKEKTSPEQDGAGKKEQQRRRLLDLFSSNTSSAANFQKEYFDWKAQFSRVRLNPAKHAEEVLVKGEKLLQKFAAATREKDGIAETEADIKTRSDLERQMQAPMAHLTRLVEQVRGGKFKAVHERYGKWAKVLEGRPEMSKLMHSYGTLGLSRFGYEPQSEFMDFREADFVCDASVVCAA